jgi:flagellar hook-associated protein 1 FlgK
MANILTTGVSGLLAFQRALDTTSHNIANANTEGYSRQIVNLASRGADRLGSAWVGNGVDVRSIRRLYDETLTGQLRTATSSVKQLDTFGTYAERLDKLLNDSSTGLQASLQQYTNAVETLASTPSSVAARQLLLSQSQSLVNRLKGFQSALNALGTQASTQLTAEVAAINSISQGIATINQQVVASNGTPLKAPNDLFDERDQLLKQLSEHVAFSTVEENNGALSVYIGSGQTLVNNVTAVRLLLQGDVHPVEVTRIVSGGSLGGLLQLQSELLTPAQNALGQIAVSLVTGANAQHQQGLDFNGQFGGPLFALAAPTAIGAHDNVGSALANVTRADLGALTTDDYELRFDGSAWNLLRHDSRVSVAMTGSGTSVDPFRAEGLAIVVSGAPVADDRILIRPTHDVVNGLRVLVTSPDQVAAAAPVLTAATNGNTGSGRIDDGQVLNASSWVRGTYTLQFTSASAWQIRDSANAVVSSGSYSDGGNIDFNGMRVSVSGAPATGDKFTIADNSRGSGDGRNARAIATRLNAKVLGGGALSTADAVSRLIGDVGVKSSQAQAGRDAQSAVLTDASVALSDKTGVNLDEEAANLVRFQQAYQAAAQVIAAAHAMFESLLDATRR